MRVQLRKCIACGHEREFPARSDAFAVCMHCSRTTEHVAVCACGCKAPIPKNLRADARYLNPVHRTRGWKQRVASEQAA